MAVTVLCVVFIVCYQPRNDMLPCLDVIKEYLGLSFTFPDVVHIHRGASSKVHDCDKMKEEGRIDVSQRHVLSLCVTYLYIDYYPSPSSRLYYNH